MYLLLGLLSEYPDKTARTEHLLLLEIQFPEWPRLSTGSKANWTSSVFQKMSSSFKIQVWKISDRHRDPADIALNIKMYILYIKMNNIRFPQK